jgi:hypothetical protein
MGDLVAEHRPQCTRVDFSGDAVQNTGNAPATEVIVEDRRRARRDRLDEARAVGDCNIRGVLAVAQMAGLSIPAVRVGCGREVEQVVLHTEGRMVMAIDVGRNEQPASALHGSGL